jgi:hypothetical protein
VNRELKEVAEVSAVHLKAYRSEEICASILINAFSEIALTLTSLNVFVYINSLVQFISVPPTKFNVDLRINCQCVP